ncbi:hypothetical protein BH10CYA1_BH10CYA1_30540 [soil metagenome]
MTNTTLQKIETIWNEFSRKPFPEGASFKVADERDLRDIDTFAAGCISAFIHAAGQLDQQRYDCLKTCLQDLSIGIKDLDAGPLKTYAEQLHLLSKLVLEYLDKKSGASELAEDAFEQNR